MQRCTFIVLVSKCPMHNWCECNNLFLHKPCIKSHLSLQYWDFFAHTLLIQVQMKIMEILFSCCYEPHGSIQDVMEEQFYFCKSHSTWHSLQCLVHLKTDGKISWLACETYMMIANLNQLLYLHSALQSRQHIVMMKNMWRFRCRLLLRHQWQ